MRNIILMLTALILPLFGFGQVNFSIIIESGNIDHQPKAFLRKEGKIDSFMIVDNKLSYSGSLAIPQSITLAIDSKVKGKYESLFLFITGGPIGVRILQDKTIKIEGNEDAEECYNKLTKPSAIFNVQLRELYQQKARTISSHADTTLLQKKINKAADSCYQIFMDYIRANPNSLVSVRALYYMNRGKYTGKVMGLSDLETMYLSLDPLVRNSPYGQQYAADLKKWKEQAELINKT